MNDTGDPIGIGMQGLNSVEGLKRLDQLRDQHGAAPVERRDLKLAISRYDYERRIDKSYVPAGIAARILIAGSQQHATVGIQRVNDRFHYAIQAQRFGRAVHHNAASRAVLLLIKLSHHRLLWFRKSIIC